MKVSQKIIFILSALILMLTLTGCDGAETEATAAEIIETIPETTPEVDNEI